MPNPLVSAGKHFSLIRVLTIILLTICSLLTHTVLSNAKTHSPHILLLNSYHEGYKGTDDIVTGFREVIKEAFPDASIKTEYLDSKYYSGTEYDEKLSQLLNYKFQKDHFDLIVASDDYAFNFVEKNYNAFFPHLPVVFCGTNAFDIKRLEGKENFVGIDERPSFKESIDLIFRLRPETKRIVVIHDDSITGQLNSEIFRLDASDHSMKAEFVYLTGLDLENLIEQLQKLSHDTTVFYFASFVKSSDGKQYSSNQALKILAAKSPVPIFGGWEFNLNHGIIGGKLINLVKHGSLAGRVAVEFLNGKPPASMTRLLPSPNSYMFDDKELKRFQIKDSLLPQESTIINRPPTFYQKNRADIFITLSTLLALIVIGTFISIYKSRSHLQKVYHEQLKTEKRLRDSEAELRQALSEIKTLQGILPICSYCKSIRNDEGYYEQIEGYIHKHSGADFSHTICPACMKKHYPEFT